MTIQIHQFYLQFNNADTSDTGAPFLNLHFFTFNGFVSSKIYYKHDDFDFDIVKFPLLDGDVLKKFTFLNLLCLRYQTVQLCDLLKCSKYMFICQP